MIKKASILLALLLSATTWVAPVSAERVLEIPLTVDTHHFQAPLAHALGMEGTGEAILAADTCNRIRISDPLVESASTGLTLDMALRAETGTDVFGGCVGPGHWNGRIRIDLVPSISDDGLALLLRPVSAELRHADGRTGLMTRPARILAEQLILPRVDNARLDLHEPLRGLDDLLASLLPTAGLAEPLVHRSRLASIETSDQGFRAGLEIRIPVRDGFVESESEAISEPVFDPEELVRWERIEDELDGFLTVIISRFARQAEQDDLRLELLGVLLDARYAIARALSEDNGSADPVRTLFVESWDRLRPHLQTLEQAGISPDETGFRLAAFLAGGDLIVALDELGPEYGLEISRDGIRRLARLLLEEEAPVSFVPLSLDVDPDFRSLFGFDQVLPEPDRTAISREAGPWRWWYAFLSPAHAATRQESPVDALAGLVPRLAILDEYLELVSTLLAMTARAWLDNGARVPAQYHERMEPLIRATAWKESCWRHYVGTSSEPTVIRSPIGAVGMMQINGRVWRSIYDIDRLEADMKYNITAGIEILEHYLVDYAIRRGEHEQPGGVDNLIRATYAAYNGGPSHLARYRRDETPGRLRAIDNEFWHHYQHMKSEGWPDVGTCYSVDR